MICKLSPHGIAFYEPRKSGPPSQPPQCSNSTNGVLSKRAKSRLKRAVGWLVIRKLHSQKWSPSARKSLRKKLAFITLTLPSSQIHTDGQIKAECLNQFLTEMRQSFGAVDYVWRAEKAENRRIHFHILWAGYIPHRVIRNTWNRCVEKLGYVTRFAMDKGHCDPNSTDVHSLRKVNNVAAYVSKYIGKSEDSAPITGRLWFCSESVSKCSDIWAEQGTPLFDHIEQLIIERNLQLIDFDFCTYVSHPVLLNLDTMPTDLSTILQNQIAVRGFAKN